MYCPFCSFEETKVIDSRLSAEGQQVRRRRECLRCGERFTTFESAELVMPRVVKSDSSREPFDEAKLRSGMMRALEKRPVASEAVDAAVNHVCHKLRTLGEREVPARLIVFPEENHWVLRGENSRFYYAEVHAWLGRWLASGTSTR